MSKVYRMYFDCGRMGELEGVFIAKEEDMNELIGNEIYFGEVLGKNSEIYGELEDEDITEISDDPKVVKILSDLFGETISGYNPFDYYKEEE